MFPVVINMNAPDTTLNRQSDTPIMFPEADASPIAKDTPPQSTNSPKDSETGGNRRFCTVAILAVTRGIEALQRKGVMDVFKADNVNKLPQ